MYFPPRRSPPASSLACLKSTVNIEISLQFRLDIRNLLDQAQFINALCIVRHRAIASTAIVTGPIPRNPNATRPNAKTATAGCRRRYTTTMPRRCPTPPRLENRIRHRHQSRDTTPPSQNAAEISRRQSAQDIQRRPTLPAGIHNFPHMPAMHAGKHLREFRNQRPASRAATDDRRQLPPQIPSPRSMDSL